MLRIVRSHADLEDYVLFMLHEPDWRPQLVGAVAAFLGVRSAAIISQLWLAFDTGSWVSPQLAAVLSRVDPKFADHAVSRLAERCPTIANPAIEAAPPLEKHVARGSAGPILRSCKAVAALLRLLETEPEHDSRVLALQDDEELVQMVATDVDKGGEIATRWLNRIVKISNMRE